MLVRDFSANVLLGMPALILPLLREAKQLDPTLRIEKVVYGGTPMTESDKEWLRTELGTICIIQRTTVLESAAKYRVKTGFGIQVRIARGDVAEAGVPGYEAVAWLMVATRAGLPTNVLDKLHSELKGVLAQPEIRNQIAEFSRRIVALQLAEDHVRRDARQALPSKNYFGHFITI